MIVKVPERRRDGRSSFEDLGKYITEGIGQSGINTEVGSFDRLTQYITKECVLNALGEDVDKTIAVEIGNIEGTLGTAAGEMSAVAAKNPAADNPVLHYILSWPEHEKPEPGPIFEAARSTLKALRLEDHQYIIAIHDNTENRHAHIEVNRVHPITFKAQRIEWLHKTLHKAAREVEIAHGWSHDPGLYNVVVVNGVKYVVESTDAANPDQVKGKAGRFEAWTGEQSFESWCKDAPTKALKEALENENTSSWQQVHQVLAQFALELRDSGGGGMRVHALDQPASQHPLSVSASKAFRFLKRPALEQRFGKFERSTGNFAIGPVKTYRRDPAKRLERRLERNALRDGLQERFSKEQKAARLHYDIAKQELAKQFDGFDAARLKALDERYKSKRASIKADPSLSSTQKQQAYMLAKVAHLEIRHELRALIVREKQERRELLPPLPSWRSWVEEQALQGDEAAISALRGMVYQDKRDAKQSNAASVDEGTVENAIWPAQPSLTDPFVRKIPNLIWKVSRNGTVAYSFKSGEIGFIDAGEKLVFGRSQVSDEALALTLQYAKDKWRDELRVTGGDAVFKVRVACMANQLGIALANADLKALQAQYKAPAPQPMQAPQPAVPRAIEKQLVQLVMPMPATKVLPLEAVLQTQEANADVQHAITQRNRYVGKIVAEDTQTFVQSVGKGKIIIHDKRLFGAAGIEVGKSITIAYQSGKATIVARKTRSEEKGR